MQLVRIHRVRHVERFENKSGELVKDAPRAPRLLCRKKDMRITRTITVVIETVETLVIWRRPKAEGTTVTQDAPISVGAGSPAPSPESLTTYQLKTLDSG